MALKVPQVLRRAVVPRVDDVVLRRYRTLAGRRVRTDALDEATVRAAARIAKRAVEDGRSVVGSLPRLHR